MAKDRSRRNALKSAEKRKTVKTTKQYRSEIKVRLDLAYEWICAQEEELGQLRERVKLLETRTVELANALQNKQWNHLTAADLCLDVAPNGAFVVKSFK